MMAGINVTTGIPYNYLTSVDIAVLVHQLTSARATGGLRAIHRISN
jgi:hypothetical protein